jgi:hypothetical protein
MGNTHISLPFTREAPYRESVDNPAQYRPYLSQMLSQHLELFPKGMDQGFTLHDSDASVKQDLSVRRIQWPATGAVFTLHPSFIMPSMIARTDAVETALYLRQWGVPFDALASVCGRDARCWYRAWRTCGRPSLLGTTVKDPQKVPTDLVADEKLTWGARQQVSVPTTVGGGCFLGVSVVAAATTAAATLASTISRIRPAMSSIRSPSDPACPRIITPRARRYGSSASWRDWATRAPVESQISKSSSW